MTEFLLLLIPAIVCWRRDSALIWLIPTMTASLHPDPKRRRDALRALDALGR